MFFINMWWKFSTKKCMVTSCSLSCYSAVLLTSHECFLFSAAYSDVKFCPVSTISITHTKHSCIYIVFVHKMEKQ